MGTSSSNMRIIYDLGVVHKWWKLQLRMNVDPSAVPFADSHFGWDFALVNQSGFRDPWGMVHQLARMTLGISTLWL